MTPGTASKAKGSATCACGCGGRVRTPGCRWARGHHMRRREDIAGAIRRFNAKVDQPEGGCWEWQGYVADNGYGQFGWNGELWSTHRFAYTAAYGAPPAGFYVCHHCDNRKCCRPSHLFLGTAKDNNDDRDRKGRRVQTFGEAHGTSRLSREQVAEIRGLVDRGATRASVARDFGITSQYVGQLARGLWRRAG